MKVLPCKVSEVISYHKIMLSWSAAKTIVESKIMHIPRAWVIEGTCLVIPNKPSEEII